MCWFHMLLRSRCLFWSWCSLFFICVNCLTNVIYKFQKNESRRTSRQAMWRASSTNVICHDLSCFESRLLFVVFVYVDSVSCFCWCLLHLQLLAVLLFFVVFVCLFIFCFYFTIALDPVASEAVNPIGPHQIASGFLIERTRYR